VAINERGQIVGTSATKSGKPHAFQWKNGRMRDLGAFGPKWRTGATAVNSRGQVIGYAFEELGSEPKDWPEHAFVWEHGRLRDLGTGTSSGFGVSEALDINESGQIAGVVATDPTTWHAYLWENGIWSRILLPKLGAEVDAADDINDAGQVVGTYMHATDSPPRVFLWENGQARDLGGGFGAVLNQRGAVLVQSWPGQPHVYRDGHVTVLRDPTARPSRDADGFGAVALNDNGWVVGSDFARTLPRRAALWINGRMRRLGTLGGKTSGAVAINNHGQIVGRSALTGSTGFHAFVWEDGRMTDLGTLRGLVSEAVAINDYGQIIGSVITKPSTGKAGDKVERHAVLWMRRG